MAVRLHADMAGADFHDDVIKWKHFPRYWPFARGIRRSPVNSPHKGQWRGALMFSLICAQINGWVNNRKAGDLRRHRAHYDVIVMLIRITIFQINSKQGSFATAMLSWHIETFTVICVPRKSYSKTNVLSNWFTNEMPVKGDPDHESHVHVYIVNTAPMRCLYDTLL